MKVATRSPHRRSARGFSLIELMIAVTVGLLLTIVVSQVFLGSRRTYSTTDDVARMQENMRYAHDVMSRVVRMAGYVSAPARYPITVDTIAGVFTGANVALAGEDGGNGDVNVPDTLTVRFQGSPDNSTVDCAGRVIGPNEIATNTFSIVVNATTRVPALVCTTVVGGANVATELITDVENMQILYGEETSGDFTADRYVKRLDVDDMDRVISVRIALLFRTPNLFVRSNPDTTEHELHGVKTTAPGGDEATRIRRAMTLTVAMRNRSP